MKDTYEVRYKVEGEDGGHEYSVPFKTKWGAERFACKRREISYFKDLQVLEVHHSNYQPAKA